VKRTKLIGRGGSESARRVFGRRGNKENTAFGKTPSRKLTREEGEEKKGGKEEKGKKIVREKEGMIGESGIMKEFCDN
jgi:hypothetical protein